MTCHGNCHYGQGVNTYAAIQILKQAGTELRVTQWSMNLLSNQFSWTI